MGKGPGTIYKECVARAKSEDKLLASLKNDDVQKEINLQTGFCSLFEKDIRRIFFNQNYSERSTDKALKQWCELDLTAPYQYKYYKVYLFLETNTRIPKGAE